MDRSERLHSGDGFLEKNFTFPATFGVEGKWALVAAFGVQVGVEHSELHGHSDNICCHLHPHVLQMTSCVNLLLVWYNERLLFIISSWLLGAIQINIDVYVSVIIIAWPSDRGKLLLLCVSLQHLGL